MGAADLVPRCGKVPAERRAAQLIQRAVFVAIVCRFVGPVADQVIGLCLIAGDRDAQQGHREQLAARKQGLASGDEGVGVEALAVLACA